MRLFIAIHFDEKTNDQLIALQEKVTAVAYRSRPSRKENLHLTLAFLGETAPERIEDLQRILQRTSFSPFQLTFETTGFFTSKDGDIYWAGLGESQELWQLQRQLSRQLREAGFQLDKNPFKPHITLARQVIFKTPKSSNPSSPSTKRSENVPPAATPISNPFTTTASSISLMLSHQMKGRLTYTELYRKRAGKKAMGETDRQ